MVKMFGVDSGNYGDACLVSGGPPAASRGIALLREEQLVITTTAVKNRHSIAFGFSQSYRTVWAAKDERINHSKI